MSSHPTSFKLFITSGSKAKYLPEYFEPWNRLAREMPDLVVKHELRKAVDEMALLDHRRLSGYREHRLAHLQLVIITAGYVWQEGESGAAKHLPECVAVPLWQISQHLGIQPIISHPDMCLANWAYTDDKKDVRCLYLSPGGNNCHWFFKVTVNTEMAFARGFQTVQSILDATAEGDTGMLKPALVQLTAVVEDMASQVKRMHENLSADTFYNEIRPFLSGWGGEGNPLPDGLIYEGISEVPVKMSGGSAAQSTTLQLIDALLGIEHQADKQQFLLHMREFMPPSHRQLVVDVENSPTPLRLLVKDSCDRELASGYNECVSAVMRFRSLHIQVVVKYVVIASKKGKTNDFESLAAKGTGGTDLLPFLKELRSDTERKMVRNTAAEH